MGRKVYDGGGITPDSLLEKEKYTRFVQNVAGVGTYIYRLL